MEAFFFSSRITIRLNSYIIIQRYWLDLNAETVAFHNSKRYECNLLKTYNAHWDLPWYMDCCWINKNIVNYTLLKAPFAKKMHVSKWRFKGLCHMDLKKNIKRDQMPLLWLPAWVVVKLADPTNRPAGPQNKIATVFSLWLNCSLIWLLGTKWLLKTLGPSTEQHATRVFGLADSATTFPSAVKQLVMPR